MASAVPVVVIGGCVVDIIYRAKTKGTTATSMLGTSTPCTLVRRSHGGVGRNISEALARLGVAVKLFSVVGDDPAGEDLIAQCKALRIDVEHVERVARASTASYTAILDGQGELATASADMAIFDEALATGAHLVAITKWEHLMAAPFIVLDGNVPKSGIEAVASFVAQRKKLLGRSAADPPRLVFDPISKEKATKAAAVLHAFSLVKPNHLELEILVQAVGGVAVGSRDDAVVVERVAALAADLVRLTRVQCVLCTCGPRGSVLTTLNSSVAGGGSFGTAFAAPSLDGEAIAKVTGAGDSFLAGFIFGQLLGLGSSDCVALANEAAKLALTSTHVISPKLTKGALLAPLNSTSRQQSRL